MSKVLADLILEQACNDLEDTLSNILDKAIVLSESINEELTPMMGSITDMISQAEARLAAAKKGLGLSNRLRTPEERKRNRSRILGNLNKLRNELALLTRSLENVDEEDPEFGREIIRRSMTQAI